MIKMKWLFALLVLANIGLWMWGSWYKDNFTNDETTIMATARTPLMPEKMRLLSEPGVKLIPLKTQATLASAEPSVEPGATLASRACYRIGPFLEPELAAIIGAKLEAMHIAAARRIEDKKTITTYRVYLPPFPSKEAAEKQRQELTDLGFEDHAVIQEEAWHNAISLGLFGVEANAENRIQELAAKGVQAQLQMLEQTQVHYWLELPPSVLPQTLDKVRQQNLGAKDIQLHQVACPAPAVLPMPLFTDTLGNPPN